MSALTPPALQDALLRMDASALSVEQLSVLSRAVPDDQERKDVELYLAGAHPKYRSVLSWRVLSWQVLSWQAVLFGL